MDPFKPRFSLAVSVILHRFWSMSLFDLFLWAPHSVRFRHTRAPKWLEIARNTPPPTISGNLGAIHQGGKYTVQIIKGYSRGHTPTKGVGAIYSKSLEVPRYKRMKIDKGSLQFLLEKEQIDVWLLVREYVILWTCTKHLDSTQQGHMSHINSY